jgi:hypothetical protein
VRDLYFFEPNLTAEFSEFVANVARSLRSLRRSAEAWTNIFGEVCHLLQGIVIREGGVT